jgi:hypothetical protein
MIIPHTVLLSTLLTTNVKHAPVFLMLSSINAFQFMNGMITTLTGYVAVSNKLTARAFVWCIECEAVGAWSGGVGNVCVPCTLECSESGQWFLSPWSFVLKVRFFFFFILLWNLHHHPPPPLPKDRLLVLFFLVVE